MSDVMVQKLRFNFDESHSTVINCQPHNAVFFAVFFLLPFLAKTPLKY